MRCDHAGRQRIIRTFSLVRDPSLPFCNEGEYLLLYDPDGSYGESCLELANDTRRVIDARGSSIESGSAA